MAITFSVPGDPVPQPRTKVCVRNQKPHGYVEKKHPIHAYRRAVAIAAKAAGATPSDAAPITLIVDFVFARPKSHYRKSGLRNNAPRMPRADCSNLLKGVEDALNGVAWVDDTQIGRVVVEKTYGTEGRTTVRVT